MSGDKLGQLDWPCRRPVVLPGQGGTPQVGWVQPMGAASSGKRSVHLAKGSRLDTAVSQPSQSAAARSLPSSSTINLTKALLSKYTMVTAVSGAARSPGRPLALRMDPRCTAGGGSINSARFPQNSALDKLVEQWRRVDRQQSGHGSSSVGDDNFLADLNSCDLARQVRAQNADSHVHEANVQPTGPNLYVILRSQTRDSGRHRLLPAPCSRRLIRSDQAAYSRRHGLTAATASDAVIVTKHDPAPRARGPGRGPVLATGVSVCRPEASLEVAQRCVPGASHRACDSSVCSRYRVAHTSA